MNNKNHAFKIKFFFFLLIGVFVFFGPRGPTAFAYSDIEVTPTFTGGMNVDLSATPVNGGVICAGGSGQPFYHKTFAGSYPDTSTPVGTAQWGTCFNSTWTWNDVGPDYSNPYDVSSSGAWATATGDYWESFHTDPTKGDSYYFNFHVTSGAIDAPFNCSDGIMNGNETGIDIGGSCATLTINTPVDTTNVQDFTNFSVTYNKVGIPSQNHQVLVQWSDSSSLLATCKNGVAGSLYTGAFVAGSSYSVCTNALPRIYIDLNTISFSSGITSYTGSVPKSHSLTNGTTYYAQAFIMGDDGIYYVASPVISFTASSSVPIVTGNGTISNDAGSGTITGTGTHFTQTLHIGDTLTVGGQQCSILSIASDTELECTPLTSSHSTASYTQNSNFDNSVVQETCSTWDFGCYIKNVISWFFGVSDTNLQAFGNLKDTLSSRFPFSYIADVGVLWGDAFNQSASSFSISILFLGHTFNLISTTQLNAISFEPLVKTIMSAIAMFFTAMFIYRKVLKIHDQGHQTV